MDKLSVQSLLENISEVQVANERLSQLVGKLVLDSRQVKQGDTFVATVGFQLDARNFIANACKQGAELVIAEAENNQEFLNIAGVDSDSIIWIKNLRDQLSQLASNFYHNPTNQLKTIGVTGTNGKTSCSYLIAKTLQKLHFECYLLGTLGVGQSHDLKTSVNTTADAVTMQQVLAEAVESGVQFVSMEVSSHGLSQSRVACVKFTTAIFTNLTRDHLDYHGDMENYGEAKRQLFLQPSLKNAVLNMDDKFIRKLEKDEQISAIKWLVTTKLPTSGSNLNRWIWAEDVIYSIKGLHAKVYTPWGSGTLESNLIGQFNLSNLLLVIAALGSILKDVYPILNALKEVRSAPGRMDRFGNEKTPMAVVDYAHTPDALEQSLKALREHNVGMIWCVFGCGGDRDTGKRAIMARIAEKLANKVIVTSDNPRTELPETIKKDIFEGFKKPEKVTYIEDRQQAIIEIVNKAKVGDAILIAGKGHEDYQIIGQEKIHLSDLEIVKKAIEDYQL